MFAYWEKEIDKITDTEMESERISARERFPGEDYYVVTWCIAIESKRSRNCVV